MLSGCSQVRWRPDLGGAMRLAGRTNRMVFVTYWSAFNAECARMDREVFSQEDVAASVNTAIPVRLDAVFNRSFARETGIGEPPAIVILAPDGRVLRTLNGYADEGRVRGAIEAARFAM